MRFLRSVRIIPVLFLVALVALAGCGDDDNPTNSGSSSSGGLLGSSTSAIWVSYNQSINGDFEEGGGTYGSGGDIVTFNKNGTGFVNELGESPNMAFDWSIDGDQLTVETQQFGTETMTYDTTGDLMVISEQLNNEWQTFYRRHKGAESLLGTWDCYEIIDEALNEDQMYEPLSITFGSNGVITAHHPDGDMTDPYTVSGAEVTIDSMKLVFVVDGNKLYLFQHFEEYGDTVILRFTKG